MCEENICLETGMRWQ